MELESGRESERERDIKSERVGERRGVLFFY